MPQIEVKVVSRFAIPTLMGVPLMAKCDKALGLVLFSLGLFSSVEAAMTYSASLPADECQALLNTASDMHDSGCKILVSED